MIRRNYEPDRVQCQALKTDGKRCTQIATYSNGGKALCQRHHLMIIKSKEKQK
jgi:hypothetical protein